MEEDFEIRKIQEQVYRLYGHELARRIISAADTISDKNPKLSYRRCVARATDWAFSSLTREELATYNQKESW